MTALLKPALRRRRPRASAQRRRAALRTFFRLAEAWQLGDRRADHPARRRPHHALPVEAGQGRAARPASAGAPVAPVRHLLVAAHPVPGRRRADEWIRKPNTAPLFAGRSALDRMLGGQVADLFVVRQYLDAQRGGKA